MASIRFVDLRPSVAAYATIKESRNVQRFQQIGSRMLVMSSSATRSQYSRSNRLPGNPGLGGSGVSFAGINPLIRFSSSKGLGGSGVSFVGINPLIRFSSSKGGIPQGESGSIGTGGGSNGDDWFSSVLLLAVTSLVLALKCGVRVQSIVTVIGGVAIGVATAFAFAPKDSIIQHALSGLSLKILRPFSVGDTIIIRIDDPIKATIFVEGQVVEIGLATTSLVTKEGFSAVFPNSLLCRQGVVNKLGHSIVRKIYLPTYDIDKIPQISEDIMSMLRSNSNVFLEKEPAPYCFLSCIKLSYAEVTLGCYLKQMNEAVEKEILREAILVANRHGALVASYK